MVPSVMLTLTEPPPAACGSALVLAPPWLAPAKSTMFWEKETSEPGGLYELLALVQTLLRR
jgi:hypothetical protein